VSGKSRGSESAAVEQAAEDEASFALQRRRLERAVFASCVPDQSWAGRIADAIWAALRFADSDTFAAKILTIHAAQRRLGGHSSFVEMVDHFAGLLSRGAPPTSHPMRTSRNVVTRIARQTFLQIDTRPDALAIDIAPDLIVFALAPYVSLAEAQRRSRR
jgi:hypothetical protein